MTVFVEPLLHILGKIIVKNSIKRSITLRILSHATFRCLLGSNNVMKCALEALAYPIFIRSFNAIPLQARFNTGNIGHGTGTHLGVYLL